MAAGELIVIDVVTWSRGIPSKRVSMSCSDVTATPHFPTSPRDNGWSGSRPIRVGRSKATERPWLPCSSRYLKRALVWAAEPKPANCRRSEEHTSELQSHSDLVCRLLLEKKKKKNRIDNTYINQ